MIRVLVNGAAGRMGRQVVAAVQEAEGMELAGLVDPSCAGTLDGWDVFCGLEQAIAEVKPDVMVDFTRPDVVAESIRIALAAGVDCVVGTTGLTDEELAELADHGADGATLFYAPNFTIGAVLMMRFSEIAARYLPTAEIIEYHHDRKVDAPSGTAMKTAAIIAAARRERRVVPGKETEREDAVGARGADVEGVFVHSVRNPGYVAHQEVIFGSSGETLTIRHDSIDRASYMPGVLLAIRSVGDRSGLIVGLDKLMED